MEVSWSIAAAQPYLSNTCIVTFPGLMQRTNDSCVVERLLLTPTWNEGGRGTAPSRAPRLEDQFQSELDLSRCPGPYVIRSKAVVVTVEVYGRTDDAESSRRRDGAGRDRRGNE